MNGCMDGWLQGWISRWVGRWINGLEDRWMKGGETNEWMGVIDGSINRWLRNKWEKER